MFEIEVLNNETDELFVANRKINGQNRLNISGIIKEYKGKLRQFIGNRVESKEDAEDILQEVFYQLAEADRMMKPIEQVSGWLYAVARNRITDLYRKKKAGTIDEFVSEDEEALYTELGSLIFDGGSTPETEYLKMMIWEELETALSEIPTEQRYVFEQTELNGISFKELSQKTGIAINTLISRKRYAVLYLRERLLYLHDELLLYK